MALLPYPSLFLHSTSPSTRCECQFPHRGPAHASHTWNCWLQCPDESSAPKLVKTTVSNLLCLSCVSFPALDYLQSGVTFHRKESPPLLELQGANSHLLSETVRKAESVTARFPKDIRSSSGQQLHQALGTTELIPQMPADEK